MTCGLHFGHAEWTPEDWAQPVSDAAALPARWLVAAGGGGHRDGGPDKAPRALLPLDKQPVSRGTLLVQGGSAAGGVGVGGGVDVLSPAAGVVDGFQDIEHVGGGLIQAVIVRRAATGGSAAGPSEVAVPPTSEAAAPLKLRSGPPVDAKSLALRLRQAGIGSYLLTLGSLADQLCDLDGRTPDLVLVNMLPVQPESRLPYALAKFEPERLLAGLRWLKAALPVKRWQVIMDLADRRGIKTFRRGLAKIRVKSRWVLNQYPQSDPTVLFWTRLGQRLPVGALPTRAKGSARGRVGLTLLVDPVTLWALGGLAQGEMAILERPVELFAMGQTPCVVKATLGVPLADLLTRHGFEIRGKQCIVNGMLAGVEMDPQCAAVEPATALIALRDFPMMEKPSECFQCGWCVDHCPTGLNPRSLSLLAMAKGGTSAREAAEALSCVGCGLCSYVCPTRLPLAQDVLGLRGAMRRDRQGRTGRLARSAPTKKETEGGKTS